MTVVVTGAAGFIGRHLVHALVHAGHAVVGIDRSRDIPAVCNGVVGDLNDDTNASIADALAGADAVFHLAAYPGVRAAGADADIRRRLDNVEATRQVLERVPLAVPLIVTSSSSVYGGSAGNRCAEGDTPRPRGAYAISKLDVERLCAHRVSQGGHVAVARPFTVAGEGQRPDMAIALWLAAARAGRPLTVLGSPDRTRDITDVGDVVRGLIEMLERGVRATVNLGTGTGHRLRDVVAAVAHAVGQEVTTIVRPAPAEDPAATLADTRRCADLLGFVPQTDLHSLVQRQAVAAFAAAGAAL